MAEPINKQLYDRLFWDDEGELLYDLLIEEKFKKIRRLIKGFKGKVLDVGCANCWTVQLFNGTKVEHFGIDISDNALKRAEKKGVIVKRVDLDCDPIPFEDNFFDLVLCSDIIEHTLYPENILKEARRVLKEGGSLIVIVPNIVSWYNRILVLLGFYPWSVESTGTLELRDVFLHINDGHLRAYTKKSIDTLLKIVGFEVQRYLGANLNVSTVIKNVNLRTELVGMAGALSCPLFILKLIDIIGRLFSLFPSFAPEIIVKAKNPNIHDQKI
jgi:methionine biosynthesis protein MetW